MELHFQPHQTVCPYTERVRVHVLSEQMVESYAQCKRLDLVNTPFADTEVLQAKIQIVPYRQIDCSILLTFEGFFFTSVF